MNDSVVFRSNGKCLLKDQAEGTQASICPDVLMFCYQLEEGKYCNIAGKKASEIIAGMYNHPLGD
jgi:hypothetical protein